MSSRVRPMVKEMGLPLRRDIKDFTIGAANENKPLAYFNAARVAAVESKKVEEEPVVVECRIHCYDRDASIGKVSSEEFARKLKFIVPPERRLKLHPKILRAIIEHKLVLVIQIALPACLEIKVDAHGNISLERRMFPLALGFPLILLLQRLPFRRHVCMCKAAPAGRAVDVLS